MDINDFITDFSKLFEETDISIFHQDLNFKELDEWSSLLALSLIVLFDDNYGIKISAIEIRESKTISDLFTLLSKDQ